jgi:8-oxo-dGTP pyrophosphatase MutT (NUDIX family)
MRAVREVSAGGVIYRKHRDNIEIALIHVRHRWGLPKGHIEKGERSNEAAVREVREETGLEGQVRKRLGDIRYSYRHKTTTTGKPVRIYKRVYFYLLRYLKGDVRDHDNEVDEARWFPIQEALRLLKFPTERRMVQRALVVLTANEKQPARPANHEQQQEKV